MDRIPADWNRVKELFQTALEFEPSLRAAFLAENCQDEQTRKEVEALLRNYQEAGNFLNDPIWNRLWEGRTTEGSYDSRDPWAPFTTASETEVIEPMTGRRLGAYKIVRRIGQGGMAGVFVAMRADDEYEKQVAIKLVQPGLDSRELLSRFRNERQTLADLDHPNIVKLLDGGSTPEGLPFLVMDYVEGTPVDDYCDRHKLSVHDRLRLFSKVCEAVQYAHQKSIVHRDLKPSNILVTNDGTPKVLDFGIAKVLSPPLSAQALLLTQTGTRCMTPAYASPEQMRGNSISTATDVYSLGVVLYELLSGHRPYRLKENTPVEIERAICEQEPEPPSTVISRVETEITSDGVPVTKTPELVSKTREGAPEKLRRHLRGDLDNIVLKALQKEADRRYASVEEFSQDISRHLQHLPVKVRRRTLIYSASRFLRRHKAPLSAVLFLLIVVAGAAAWTLYSFGIAERFLKGNSGTQIRSLAVLPLVNLSGDPAQEYFSDGMTDSLITHLSQIGTLKVISRTSSMRYKKSDKLLPQIARDLNVDGIIEGTVQQSDNHVHITVQLIHGPSDKPIWTDSYDRDMHDVFALQQTITNDIASQVRAHVTTDDQIRATQPPPPNLTVLEAYLQGSYHLNHYEQGLSDEELKKARKYFQNAIDADPSFAPAYNGLAITHLDLLWASKEDFEIGRRAAERAVELAPTSAENRVTLARVKESIGDYRGTEEESRRAVALNPNDASAHSQLSSVLQYTGRLDEALKEGQIAEALDPRGYNDQLAWTLQLLGDYDRAISMLRVRAQNDPNNGFFHHDLFRIYAAAGMHKQAIQELETTATLFGSPQVAARIHHAFVISGYRGAMRYFAEDLEHLTATKRLFMPVNLAEVYAVLGDKDRAFYWLEQAYSHRYIVAAETGLRLTEINIEPMLSPLRSDPRFKDLLHRLGLPDVQLSEPKFRSNRSDDER